MWFARKSSCGLFGIGVLHKSVISNTSQEIRVKSESPGSESPGNESF